MPEPASTNVKQTPGRRRPGPNAVRSASRKNYSSENDAASVDPSARSDFAHRRQSPQTPKKGMPKNATPNSQPTGKSNKRNGNRNYPQNISTSPAPAKPGRRTPPQSAGSKSGAFAGATFHASPAPSSLPLPSFFTKTSSPDTPHATTVNSPCPELSPPASDTEALPGRARHVAIPKMSAAPNESPLDIFFRADRAEKDRAQRPSSAILYNDPRPPYSPPTQQQTILEEGSQTFPRNRQQQVLRRPAHLRDPSSGISSAELNGDPKQPIGPAFATSFQERMRAVRPVEASMSTSRGPTGTAGFRDPAVPATSPPDLSPGSATTDERSEALKRYLFSKAAVPILGPAIGTAALSHSTSGPAVTPTSAAAAPIPGPILMRPTDPTTNNTRHVHGQSSGFVAPRTTGFAPSAFQNIYSPSTANSSNSEAANIAAMENSLRQILNLGSSPLQAGSPQASYARQN